VTAPGNVEVRKGGSIAVPARDLFERIKMIVERRSRLIGRNGKVRSPKLPPALLAGFRSIVIPARFFPRSGACREKAGDLLAAMARSPISRAGGRFIGTLRRLHRRRRRESLFAQLAWPGQFVCENK
jgi:hypothetical protein